MQITSPPIGIIPNDKETKVGAHFREQIIYDNTMNPSQTVDLARLAELDAEIREVTNIRNNMPREHWAYLEGKLQELRAKRNAIEREAESKLQAAKTAMLKAILVCDYITDVAEDFADASKKMIYSGEAGNAFRDMVKVCSDRHKILMREWGEVVKCIDSKGDKLSESYVDWYDAFKERIEPVVNEFIGELKKDKRWKRL